MQATAVGRPSGSFGDGYSATRSVWLAVALAVCGLVCVAAWSLTSPGSGDGSATVVGGVVDSSPEIAAVATASRDARVSVGESFAGSWVDDSGQLQVAGTNVDALAGVASDAVSAQVVEFSLSQLNAVVDVLNADLSSPDSRLRVLSTGWSVNVIDNRVDVETADQVAVADVLRSVGVDERLIRFVPPVERQTLQDSKIYEEFDGHFGWRGWASGPSPTGGCSMGAPVVGGFVSAAHCAIETGTLIGFVGTPGTVGRVEQSLHYENIDGLFVRLDAPHTVDPVVPAIQGGAAIPILGLAEAPVGAEVCKIGLTTGRTCGKITARNSTIGDFNHPYVGQITTDICAAPGDSGGILMWGNQVQGVVSTGDRNDGTCSTSSAFTPINPLLDRFNVDLMTPNGPVPHLDNYEPVSTFQEAVPTLGGDPSASPPPLVVSGTDTPSLPGPSPVDEAVVLPAANDAVPAPGSIDDAVVLPAADAAPSVPAAVPAGDAPVLPAPGPVDEVVVLPAAVPAGDAPVLPAPGPVDEVVVLPAADAAPPVPATAPSPFDGAVELPGVPSSVGGVPLAPTTVPPPAVSQPSDSNLLVNGGFESLSLPFNTLAYGPQVGWTSSQSGDHIETWHGAYLQVEATEGKHLIELNGHGPDSISQTVSVVPGARYQWTFDHRGRVDADQVLVTFNGRDPHMFITFADGWATHSGEFTALAGETSLTITFAAQDPGSEGNLLDNVRLVRVG